MALNGYQKSGGKRSGGISSLYIVAVGDVAEAVYDPGTGAYSQVNLKEGATFAQYGFREGEASYREDSSVENGILRVRHTIEFSLERPDAATGEAIAGIAKASKDGMVAIITTNNGISFLVGHSEKFGSEQPLRLEKSGSTTGRKPADHTLESISLVSEDDSKSAVYTGNPIS